MRKILFLSVALVMLTGSFASTSTTIKPRLKANEIMIPIGNGVSLSLLDFSQMKIKEVEAIRGQKMKFADRLIFKSAQNKLRQQIHRDGTIDAKNFFKKRKPYYAGETGFHLGGFALGFFVGLIGVLIAYLIKDDYKKNRVKWAWLGLLAAVIFNLVVFLLLM